MCVFVTLALTPDANLDRVTRRIARLEVGKGLYDALPFDWDEGLVLRPFSPPGDWFCYCPTFLGYGVNLPDSRQLRSERRKRVFKELRAKGWDNEWIDRALKGDLDYLRAEGLAWEQFVRDTLAARDTGAVGLLLTWGGYPEPGEPPDDEDPRARTHIHEIVYLDGTEATFDRLGRLEETVLYVFV